MAEYLIYNTQHWMDKQAITIDVNNTVLLNKYNARNIKGDIIEVRPDGYWTGTKAKGFNKDVFCVICDTEKFDDVKDYQNPIVDKDGIIKKKASCKVDIDTFTFKNSICELTSKLKVKNK